MMKNTFRFLIVLSALCVACAAYAVAPASYYSRMDGKKKDALKTAAFETVRPHTVVTYNSLFPQQFPKTDVYPEL